MKRRATEKASSRKSEAAARPLGIAVNIDAESSLPLFLPPPLSSVHIKLSLIQT